MTSERRAEMEGYDEPYRHQDFNPEHSDDCLCQECYQPDDDRGRRWE
jgi:hypothetical protein